MGTIPLLWALALMGFLLFQSPLAGQESPQGLLHKLLLLTRATVNLPVLPWDGQLAQTAQSYAEEMAKRGLLSHEDLKGGRAADRFSWTGRLVKVGEILGAAGTLEELPSAWLSSPGHKKILLGKSWRAWGMGVFWSGNLWVAVVLFLE